MRKALVIGGGIAGATVSLALHKAGIESEVYEAYPHATYDAGAYITVMNNGMNALSTIGAQQRIIDASFPARGIQHFSATGKALGGQPYRQDGAGWPRTLTRGALCKQLHDELDSRGLTVHHDKRLRSAESTDSGGVVAQFEDGSEAMGDLLIGADGLHSVTRRLIDPTAATPRYTGLRILYGYAPGRLPGAALETYYFYYGRRGVFGYIVTEDDQTWWFARLPGKELTKDEFPTPDEWREHVIEVFTGDTIPVAEVIEFTGDSLFATNAYDIPAVQNWHNSSMVLIGDAVHAASPAAGQGASMAIEDSITLAKCLRDIRSTPEAFKAYAHLRRERVERLVATSAKLDTANQKFKTINRIKHDYDLSRSFERQVPPLAWLLNFSIDWESHVHDRKA